MSAKRQTPTRRNAQRIPDVIRQTLPSTGNTMPKNARGKKPKASSLAAKGMKVREKDLMPAVYTWSKLLTDPWNFNPKESGMPLAEDNYPCPSVKGRNYATSDFQVTPGSDLYIYPFPDAQQDYTGGDMYVRDALWNNPGTGAPEGFPGLIYDVNDGGGADQGVAFAVRIDPAGSDQPMAQNSTDLTPVFFAPKPVPLTLAYTVGSQSNAQVRTYAYGIRVTYVGVQGDLGGTVEFVQARENVSHVVPQSVSFNQLRSTDPSYRRRAFGKNRCHEFSWHPNCDSVKNAKLHGTSAVNIALNSRMCLRITDVPVSVTGTDMTIRVEAIHFQELVSNKIQDISTITPVTPSAVQVQNALVTGHGEMNYDITPTGSRVPGTSLHTEVVAHKVAAHPALRKLVPEASMGESLLEGARTIVPELFKHVKQALPAPKDILPMLLSG